MTNKWTISIDLDEAINRLNDMKRERWYGNLSSSDKAAIQYAIDYLEDYRNGKNKRYEEVINTIYHHLKIKEKGDE